jgi:hypothetical protein
LLLLRSKNSLPAPECLPTLTKRRQPDWNYGKPVIQVLAEQALRDSAFQVPVRRCNDAHVDSLRRGSADLLDLVLLNQSQHTHLQVHRHLTDFIQEYRTAVGDLDFAPS